MIDSHNIVTAAHCIDKYDNDQLRYAPSPTLLEIWLKLLSRVRLGEWDVNSDAEFFPNREYEVASVTIHPLYESGKH